MTLISCYNFGPKWTWERWQWSGTQHSPKLHYYWNLTIRPFGFISRTLVRGRVLPLYRGAVCVCWAMYMSVNAHVCWSVYKRMYVCMRRFQILNIHKHICTFNTKFENADKIRWKMPTVAIDGDKFFCCRISKLSDSNAQSRRISTACKVSGSTWVDSAALPVSGGPKKLFPHVRICYDWLISVMNKSRALHWSTGQDQQRCRLATMS